MNLNCQGCKQQPDVDTKTKTIVKTLLSDTLCTLAQ